MVDVEEAYRDFSPPCDVRGTVLELLDSVPTERLTGLRRVILTNSAALTRKRRRAWSWSRGRKARHISVVGLYHGGRNAEGASIELFVDQIVVGPPVWLLRLPLVRTLLFAPALFHEIGHHVHARFRPEHREQEDVADDWAKKLARTHIRRRHPLGRAMLRPVVGLARLLQRTWASVSRRLRHRAR